MATDITTEPAAETDAAQEQVTSARFTPPATIALTFGDGLQASLEIGLLQMPADSIRWTTLAASPDEGGIVVTAVDGDVIPISAGTLRYLVDAKYAANMDAKLKTLQFSRQELERMVRENPPPDAWFDEPETDLTHESWK